MKVKTKNNNKLVTFTDPRSPVSEAYRTLRTNIQFASVDNPVKTLLIAGANPGCGKTTTTANLGVVLARAGFSVLLVDCDLRRPALHEFFDLPNSRGLTNLLVGVTKDLEAVVCQSKFETLHILPSGPVPPNPAELLSTAKMKKIVGVFTSSYDYVLFDSPPVTAVTDAAVLSRLADATIMVLDYGGVTRDMASYALEQLGKVQANVIGIVLNGMPSKQSYYYYFQEYYAEQPARRKKKRAAHPTGEAEGFELPV